MKSEKLIEATHDKVDEESLILLQIDLQGVNSGWLHENNAAPYCHYCFQSKT